jgi:hypothetical protein
MGSFGYSLDLRSVRCARPTLLVVVLSTAGCTGWGLQVLPEDRVLRPFLADPRRPHSGLRILHSFEADGGRFETVLGGQTGFVRWTPESDDPAAGESSEPPPSSKSLTYPEQALEVGMYGVMFAQWDLQHKWDLIAFDGLFGFPVVYRQAPFAVLVDIWHWSAHIGDELIERTGRERIGYRREEFSLGLSWDLPRDLRAYAEGGLGFNLGPPNKRYRLQLGMDYETSLFYAGVDLQSKEDVDWDPDFAAQAGIAIRAAGRRVARLGVEYYTGHSPYGELLGERDSWIAAGLWFDF